MWWKILGVGLFIYVLIGGLTVPLHPGITSSEPSYIKSGTNATLIIDAYNTNFEQGVNHAWIKVDSNKFIKASVVKSLSNNRLTASFNIPKDVPEESYTLITYNEKDGVALLPSGVLITANPQDDTLALPSQFSASYGIDMKKMNGIRFPYRSILNETIRNTFFHVALWMAMFVLYLIGLWHAIQYLRTKELIYDMKSAAYNKSGILYGMLGIITGSLWARYTWGDWWTNDVKLNMTTIAMFIYFGYLILRSSFESDEEKRARISAVFSIFAFVALIPLVFVVPRLQDSLHPGNGGNPALGGEDLDNTLRLFFYPSIIALILLGAWMAQLKYRYDIIYKKAMEQLPSRT
jgi:heme exporter protein C